MAVYNINPKKRIKESLYDEDGLVNINSKEYHKLVDLVDQLISFITEDHPPKLDISRRIAKEIIDTIDREKSKKRVNESYGDSPIYDHTVEAIDTMFEKLGTDPDIVRQFSEWKDLEDLVVKMVLRYDDYMAGK